MGLAIQFMLKQVVLNLGSDKVRLQSGDESDVKLGCADIPESFQERPCSEQSFPSLAAVCHTGQSGFPSKKEFLSTEDHYEHTALSVSGLSFERLLKVHTSLQITWQATHTAKSLLMGFSETFRETPDHILCVCLHVAAQTSFVCDGRRTGLTDQLYKCKPALKGLKYKVQTSSL